MKDHNLIPVNFMVSTPHVIDMVTPVIREIMKRNLFIQNKHMKKDVKFSFLFTDELLWHFNYQKTSIKESLNTSNFFIHPSQLVIVNFFHWQLNRSVDFHPIFDKFPSMNPDNSESVRETVVEMFQQEGINIPDNTIYIEFNKLFLAQYLGGVVDMILDNLPDIQEEEIIKVELSDDVKDFITAMFKKDQEAFQKTVEETVQKVFKEKMSLALKNLEKRESAPVLTTQDAIGWCQDHELPFTVINVSDVESVLSFHKKLDEMKDLPAIEFFDTFQTYFRNNDGAYVRGFHINIIENEGLTTVLSLLKKRFNGEKFRTKWYQRFLAVLFDNGFYFGPNYEGPTHQEKRS